MDPSPALHSCFQKAPPRAHPAGSLGRRAGSDQPPMRPLRSVPRPWLAFGLVAAALAGSEAAATEGSAADRARLVRTAQRLVNDAVARYTAQDYAGALPLLEEAERLAEEAEDPALASIRFNVARCLEQLDRPEAALEAYRRYDALPDAAHRKQKAFAAMRALESQVYASVSVVCAPAAAVVRAPGLLDGPRSCPLSVDRVTPGNYAVEVSAPGHAAKTEEFVAARGTTTALEIRLEPAVDLVGDSTPFPVLPVSLVGGGAVAAGVGGVFWALASASRDDAESRPPSEDRDGAVRAFELERALAYTLFGLGGALAAAGAAIHLWPAGESSAVAVGPGSFTVRF